MRAFVAFTEGDPSISTGCMLWYATYSSWTAVCGAWVEELYVRPSYRSSGLGRVLLEALRATVEGRVEWNVHVTNGAARQFYLRLDAEPQTEWTKFWWR